MSTKEEERWKAEIRTIEVLDQIKECFQEAVICVAEENTSRRILGPS